MSGSFVNLIFLFTLGSVIVSIPKLSSFLSRFIAAVCDVKSSSSMRSVAVTVRFVKIKFISGPTFEL